MVKAARLTAVLTYHHVRTRCYLRSPGVEGCASSVTASRTVVLHVVEHADAAADTYRDQVIHDLG